MTEGADTDTLSRLLALGERSGGPDDLNKSLLVLLAMGRLAKDGTGEMPWSVAEVGLADLIAKFGEPADIPGHLRAARAFTGLAMDQVWTLDTDLPADGVRPRQLSEWQVRARLEPRLERALLADPALFRQAARRIVADIFPAALSEDVLEAVGLLDVFPAIQRAPRGSGSSNRWQGRFTTHLDDYLRLTVSAAREQFRVVISRTPVDPGKRQGSFLPVETLLCLAASFLVSPRGYGGSNIDQVPEPVPELARLFKRSRHSVLEKMGNLDNSRPNGAQWDASAGATLREQSALFAHIYRVLLHAARAEGIGADRLPDFLGLAEGGELELLGQEELATMQSDDLIAPDDPEAPDPETERIRANAARVGQHVFAQNVLSNCGKRCVFCGLRPAVFSVGRMLLAGHIKPWRDSSPKERRDPANGLAGCPNHDVAFDTGLLTIQDDLQITIAASLSAAVRVDELTKRYYGRPPLLDALLLPASATPPAARYLDWHRRYIFTDAPRTRTSGPL
jgi:putative restriction endonuclease